MKDLHPLHCGFKLRTTTEGDLSTTVHPYGQRLSLDSTRLQECLCPTAFEGPDYFIVSLDNILCLPHVLKSLPSTKMGHFVVAFQGAMVGWTEAVRARVGSGQRVQADSSQAGMAISWSMGHMQPWIARNAAQDKIINLLKIL